MLERIIKTPFAIQTLKRNKQMTVIWIYDFNHQLMK